MSIPLQPFIPELYRMNLEMALPYGWDGIDKSTFPYLAAAGKQELIQQIPSLLESPGEIGEKAIPYSQRGIEIDPKLKSYMDCLLSDGAYFTDVAGSYSMEDLQILTAETGVEYTLFTVDGKSYLIRGNERGTVIPDDILKILYNKQGEFVCHSHPFIGDLNPSQSDLEFIKSLTWQQESIIIEPSGEMTVFDKTGVKEKKSISTHRDEDYYQKMFGGVK